MRASLINRQRTVSAQETFHFIRPTRDIGLSISLATGFIPVVFRLRQYGTPAVLKVQKPEFT